MGCYSAFVAKEFVSHCYLLFQQCRLSKITLTYNYEPSRQMHKWPEGSWTILQPLTGLTQVAKLRGPNSEGFYTSISPRDMRGGGDGDTFGSQNTDYSTAGEACIKYLGGPLRGYTGKAVTSTVLEIVVRPPITTLEKDRESTGAIEELDFDLAEKVLTKVESVSDKMEEDESPQEVMVRLSNQEVKASAEKATEDNGKSQLTSGLYQKLEFQNVGGLGSQLDDIARRVLASRANPEAARRLGVSHVRGLLLRYVVLRCVYQFTSLSSCSHHIHIYVDIVCTNG